MNKTCKKCKLEKSLESFHKNKACLDGLENQCKQCRKEYCEKNKERIKIYGKQWVLNNRERCKKVRHQKYLRNKEYDRIRNKQWRHNNIEKVREYHRKWANNKRATDPNYKIQHRLRNRLLSALKRKNNNKGGSLLELCGCSFEDLKKHIESQFTQFMSWDKFLNSEIHIDHIKPCQNFNLAEIEQQKTCFHYNNLRPLWATKEIAIRNGENQNYIGNLNRTKKDYLKTI